MAVDKELKDRLDAIINGLNTLTGKKKGMSSQQGGATKKTSNDGFDYRTDTIEKYNQQIREIRKETEQVKANIFSYETIYKRINRLKEEAKNIEKERDKYKKGSDKYLQQEYYLAQKLNQIEKERAKIQTEGYTKLDDLSERFDKKTSALKKGVGEIKKGFDDITKSVKGIIEP